MAISTTRFDSSDHITPNRNQLAVLGSWLAGELVTADSTNYDELRKVHDISVDRCPLAIVRAASADDVAAAVLFARIHGLPLAVRSGGHSIAHQSVVDGGIVVDLSGMKRVSIDPEARVAHIQAGATSADLAGPAHDVGLALSTGDTASVGLGGLVTGGGIGFMARKYGLTIDNLLSARVVTADGEVVTASPDEHPDLFWAIRGGGGNFGVVTDLELRLAPVGQVLGGALLLPASREVLRGYLDYAASAPDDLTTIAYLIQAPPLPFVPPERVGDLVVMILVCWTGNVEDGERALAPLRALARPVAEQVSPIPYPRIFEYTAIGPHATSIRMMFANELSDAALDAILAALERASSPFDLIQLRGLGGAILSAWLGAAEDPTPHHAWVQSLWARIRHEGAGAYVNFLEDEGEARVHDAYPPSTFDRLAAIKRTYDPEDLFKLNQNIPPAR